MRLLLAALAILVPCLVEAQVFEVGAVGTDKPVYSSYRIKGRITIADSTFSVQFPAGTTDRRIIRRVEPNTLYVTDGVSTDQIVISPMSSKINGYRYDHTIVHNYDKSVSDSKVIYFCRIIH